MNTCKPTVVAVHGDVTLLEKVRMLMKSVGMSIETCPTPGEYLERRNDLRPDCLILGVRLPQMSGLELHRRLRGEADHAPAIFLTDSSDVPTAVEAMRDGAFDFLQIPISEQYLLDRVNAAIRRHHQDRKGRARRIAAAARFRDLSPKERAVLDRVKEGIMSKDIARELGVTLKTVEFHRANIMRKVGADTLAGLLHLSLLAGFQQQD